MLHEREQIMADALLDLAMPFFPSTSCWQHRCASSSHLQGLFLYSPPFVSQFVIKSRLGNVFFNIVLQKKKLAELEVKRKRREDRDIVRHQQEGHIIALI